jgi:hypothetical protein
MYSGSRHCGKIACEVDGEFSEVMECKCSHCSRRAICCVSFRASSCV